MFTSFGGRNAPHVGRADPLAPEWTWRTFRHKKPYYSGGLVFPPGGVLLLDFWRDVFVTMAAVVLSLPQCVAFIPFLSPSFSLVFIITVWTTLFSPLFLSFFSSPTTVCLSLTLSLSVYPLQCDQVQVIPIPSVCIIIYSFFSITVTLFPPLCCMWMSAFEALCCLPSKKFHICSFLCPEVRFSCFPSIAGT